MFLAFPWFSAIESSQAGHFSEDDKLQLTANDHFSDSERKKVEKFLKGLLYQLHHKPR